MKQIRFQARKQPSYDLKAFGAALNAVFAATYKDVPNAKDMYSVASRQHKTKQKAA